MNTAFITVPVQVSHPTEDKSISESKYQLFRLEPLEGSLGPVSHACFFASVRRWFGVSASGIGAFSRLTSCGNSVAAGKLASVALR